MPKTLQPLSPLSETSASPTFGQPYPVNVDRRVGAEIVTQHYFPVSPRTIESWPLTVRRVNGKALYNTAELLAYARERLEAAPAIRGGRRSAA